mgnify:CR=1 FL=1
MQTREYYLKKRFYDNKKFPYGFSRSGDFSIAEAQCLEKYGALYKALIENQVIDPSKSDLKLIKACQGPVKTMSFEEETWLKYLNYQTRSQVWITPNAKAANSDKSSSSDELDDIEDLDHAMIDDDDDIDFID